MDERNVILRMKILGHSRAEMARCLGRSPSTVGRELRRNVQFDGRYAPGVAEIKARLRRREHLRRPKTGDDRLMRHVAERLKRRLIGDSHPFLKLDHR